MDDSARFSPTVETVRAARSWAAQWCAENGYSGDVDALVLVISELVTNAVEHGRGPVDLRLSHDGDRLVGSVTDQSAAVPLLRSDPSAHGGWGLPIVERLTDGWSVDSSASGKTVRFEFPFLPVRSSDQM